MLAYALEGVRRFGETAPAIGLHAPRYRIQQPVRSDTGAIWDDLPTGLSLQGGWQKLANEPNEQ